MISARSTRPSSKASSQRRADAPPLGVGVLLNPALPGFLDAHPDACDFVAVIPDREWTDRGVAATPRYLMPDAALGYLHALRARLPLVCHSIGLSIGSAALFDTGHVEQIARLHAELDFAWHSDHLSFARLPLADHEMHAALALPVCYDQEMLDLVAARARHVLAAVPCPFLLENNVAYIDQPEQDFSEPAFLNALAAQSGCGVLLDLHNVHVNARNHGFSAAAFVAALDLSHVMELHIAGGDELLGFYTDSHAGAVAAPVWDLLEQTLRAAPGIRAVTFEFHETSYQLLGDEGIRAELAHARAVWARCR